MKRHKLRYENIEKRYPEWDGTPDHVLALMGNVLYEVQKKTPKEWVWLDFYFDTGLTRETRDAAILDGADMSCYWANDYENYLKQEDAKRKKDIILNLRARRS